MDFAVNTSPIAVYCPRSRKIPIMRRSNWPIKAPACHSLLFFSFRYLIFAKVEFEKNIDGLADQKDKKDLQEEIIWFNPEWVWSDINTDSVIKNDDWDDMEQLIN